MRRCLAIALLAVFSLTACGQMSEFVAEYAFEDADDLGVPELGLVLEKVNIEIRILEDIASFKQTGDVRYLEQALSLRPDDSQALAHLFVLRSSERGDPTVASAAMNSLMRAESRRLEESRGAGDPPVQADDVRRNVLTSIYYAQIEQLGGSVTQPWDPPGPLAAPQTQELFIDYCVTRDELQELMADEWREVPQPLCPDNF